MREFPKSLSFLKIIKYMKKVVPYNTFSSSYKETIKIFYCLTSTIFGLLLNCCHFSSFLKLTKQNLNSTVSWGVIVYNLGYSKDLGSSKLCTRKLHIAAIQFQSCWSCRRMVFFAIFYESRLIIYYIKRFHTYQSLLQILLLTI